MNIGPVDYASSVPPDAYRCTTCGAHGVKLWRLYATLANQTDLLCRDCAGKAEGRDVSENYERSDSDQIGWRVPAVPTEEGDAYWGYAGVPDAGVQWWRRLPNRVPV